MNWLLKQLHKGNSKVLVGNLLASVIGLANFMILARIVTKEQFGEFVMFISAAGLADMIRTGFIRQAMVRQISIARPQQIRAIIGSAWTLHLIIGLVIITIVMIARELTSALDSEIGLEMFFGLYPWLLLASLPHQMFAWIAHAKRHYWGMNIFRSIVNAIFLLSIVILQHFDLTIEEFIIILIAANFIVSVVVMMKVESLIYLRHVSRTMMVSLFDFGKYSLTTLAGGNLLKSADVLIIGFMLGKEAAAIYAIPLKALDLLEIPLRGFVTTSFQRLTKFFHDKQPAAFSQHLHKMVIWITLLFSPMAFISFLFPEIIIDLLGGGSFTQSYLVLQVFAFAMILLPADKYFGVAFDSINQPGKNASKVWLMVGINIIGDVLVIRLTGQLWMVALITIINIAFGILYGILNNIYIKSQPLKYRISQA